MPSLPPSLRWVQFLLLRPWGVGRAGTARLLAWPHALLGVLSCSLALAELQTPLCTVG